MDLSQAFATLGTRTVYEWGLWLQALQERLLGMEEKAAGILGGDATDSSARPSAMGISGTADEERSPFEAGRSVAAVLEVAEALESKLEVCPFRLFSI